MKRQFALSEVNGPEFPGGLAGSLFPVGTWCLALVIGISVSDWLQRFQVGRSADALVHRRPKKFPPEGQVMKTLLLA